MADWGDKQIGNNRLAPRGDGLGSGREGGREEADRLLARVAQGDSDALEALYRQLRVPAYGLALAVLEERTEAEDVVQETFLRVWQAAGQHRPGADGRAWVLAIARNLARERLRKRKDAFSFDEVTEPLLPDPSLRVNDRLCLRQAFAVLDETERQIVMLYAVGGYSHKEIAAALGKPYATVRWKFRRAMGKLKEALPDDKG